MSQQPGSNREQGVSQPPCLDIGPTDMLPQGISIHDKGYQVISLSCQIQQHNGNILNILTLTWSKNKDNKYYDLRNSHISS